MTQFSQHVSDEWDRLRHVERCLRDAGRIYQNRVDITESLRWANILLSFKYDAFRRIKNLKILGMN